MNIAIFGAGKAGKVLYKRIIESCFNIQVLGFVDNILNGDIEDVKIYKPDEYFNLHKNDTDAVIITAGSQKTVGIMIDIARNYGIDNIYMLHDIIGKSDLPIFDNKGFIPYRVRKIRFSEEKPTLPYFEMPITDMCNLNCKGCLFACNAMNKGSHTDILQIKADLKRMSELFEDIPWIRILGGEPLLHPNIVEVLEYCRECFPESEVDLCTNGLLLPKMKSSFYECLISNRISVHISGYRPTYEMIDEIDEQMKKYNLIYVVLERNEFMKYYTLSNTNDPLKSYEKCIASACREVYRGKLSNCSAVIAFEKMNEQFGTSYKVIENIDWFNIHNENIDIWKVIKALDEPMGICRYCSDSKNEKFDWSYAGKNVTINDYILSENDAE